MARKTGVTKETAKRMILDAGAVYINYGEDDERLYGATREGSEFVVEQEVREVEIDGVRGPMKGTRRVIEEYVRLTVNLLEMTADNVAKALPGASVETETDGDGNDQDVVKRSLRMDDIEYFKNVALVADYSGSESPVVIMIKNALADGELNLSAEDREEAVVEVQFTGHYDPEELDDSPFEIRFPAEDSGSSS